MTTSGTVAQTTIDVATMIEHAFRRAGVSPAEQTTDALIAARQSLYFYLSALANDGVNLWTIEKVVLGTIPNKINYQIGTGTIDLKNCFRRTLYLPSGGVATSSAGGVAANAFNQSLTGACTQTSPNGNIAYQYTTPTMNTTVGFMPNSNQTLNPVFEASNDGATWKLLASTVTTAFTANNWYYFHVPLPNNYTYYRIRETSGGTMDMLNVVFALPSTEILLGRISLDQYSNLTDKNFSSTDANQYWFNRKVDNPEINIWPTYSTAFSQLTAYRTRQIQDVGTSINTLEIPQRWIEAGVNELSVRLLLEQPKADQQRYNILRAEADKATFRAQQEERDNSPIFFTPSIGVYTS